MVRSLTQINSLDDAMVAVASVAGVVRECSQKAEDIRTLPVEVIDALDAAGLWRVFAPREVGGSGLARLVEQYELTRAMTYADSSAGWAFFICAGTAMLVGSRLPAEGRHEVFADGVSPMAGVFMPGGQGRRVDGGVVVSGRWKFGSGILHAGWVMANVIVVDDGGVPVPGPGGLPSILSVVVPRHEVEIVDDWHVAGLRGTGSVSFTIDATMVPHRRTFPFLGPAKIDEPAYRLPLFTVVAPPFAAVAAGLAQRCVDEVIALLPTRARPPTFQPLSESATAQLTLGRAMAAVRAADESTRAVLRRYDARVDAGDDVSDLPMSDRAEVHQHVVWAAETFGAAVNDLFRLGGASAIYEPGVLQRCWRDLNTLLQHVYLGSNFHEISAQVALGMEVNAPNL